MQSYDIALTDGSKVGRYHIFISALSICCFYNSLQNGLVHDDVFAIIKNEDIRSETPITNLFINDFWGRNLQDEKSHKSFRPLCTLTFRLNYMLHGLHPYGYHLTNILLHTAVSNLFFYILYKVIFLDLLPSVLASTIFTTHPVHVEAVTGIVGRGDVLSCLLFLFTFLNYVRHLQKSEHGNSMFSYNFLLSILCGTACLFVKEHSVTVFGVCAAYDVIKNKTSILRLLSSEKKHVKSNPIAERDTFSCIPVIGRILFLSVWVVLLFAFRLHVMGAVPKFLEEDNPASFSPHLMTRILTYLYLLAFNSSLLIAPITLCYDWQVGSIPLVEYITDLRNIETIFFLAVLVSLFAVAVIRIIKDSNQEIPLLGLAFLVIPFLPASNFFLRVGFVVAERILYISSMGYCILIGYGFTLIIRYFTRSKVTKGLLPACYFIFGLLILLFSMKTIKYNTVWYSRETLFRSGVETLPHNAKVHYNYANFLKDVNSSKGDAIYHYKQAVRLYPSHSSAHNNLGSMLTSNEEAEYHFLEALKYTPGHYRAMFNLGGVYWRMKRPKDAELVLLEALRYSPDYFDAQNLLVDVLKENKKHLEAKAVYKKMISADQSKIDLLLKYATFLNDIGEFQESVDVTAKILSKDSKNYVALCNMAKIYERIGESKQSITLYERAISINRQELAGYHGLAFHHISKHDMQAANEVYERSLKHVQPTREHLRNYAAVLYQLKKYEKSIGILENLLKKHKDFFLARTTLIGFLVDMKDKRAERMITSSLELYPKDEGIRLHLADWKRSNMQYEEAKQAYLEIISQNPKHAKALQNLGTVYHIQNDLVNTEKYYDLAHRLNPTDENLIENIKKLRRLQNKAHN